MAANNEKPSGPAKPDVDMEAEIKMVVKDVKKKLTYEELDYDKDFEKDFV